MGQELHTASEFCFIIDRRKSDDLERNRQFAGVRIQKIKNIEFKQPHELGLDAEKNLYY